MLLLFETSTYLPLSIAQMDPPPPHLLVSGRHSGIARFAPADVSQQEIDKRQSRLETLLMNMTGLRAGHIEVHRNHHARHLFERTNWTSGIAER